MKRRGFSLIELLVVIGLIALLGTLTVIGIAKLQTHGKQQQTKMILQNLQSMFAEYDVNRRVPFGMGNFSGYSSLPQTGTPSKQNILNSICLAAPQNVTLDYNNNAESTTSLPTAPQSTADRKGLSGNVVVPLTRSMMAQFLASPANAAAIGKLPTGSAFTFAGYDPSVTSPAVWAVNNTYTIGQYVLDAPGGNIYIRTQLNLDSSGNLLSDGPADALPNVYYWAPALRVPDPTVLPDYPKPSGTPLPTPVVLDAWGNPIIFVMGGVLGAAPGSASGTLVAGGQQFQVSSPDFHPFFASAGPDGDFSKGDDNLYSYEK